eukprot:PhM_4_TR8397/c0_g1_i1/m.62542
MVSAAGVFIDFVVSVFRTIINIVLDVACLGVYILSSAVTPWRLIWSIPCVFIIPFQEVARHNRHIIVAAAAAAAAATDNNSNDNKNDDVQSSSSKASSSALSSSSVLSSSTLSLHFQPYQTTNRKNINKTRSYHAAFRGACIQQMTISVYQIMGVLCFCATVLTWRGPFLVRALVEHDNISEVGNFYSRRPAKALKYFMLFFTDCLLLPMFVPQIVLFFRFVRCAQSMRSEFRGSDVAWQKTDVRPIIITHFFYFFYDVICIPMVIFTAVATPWRLVLLVMKIVRMLKKQSDTSNYHGAIVSHARRSLFDLLLIIGVLPFFPWRWVLAFLQCRWGYKVGRIIEYEQHHQEVDSNNKIPKPWYRTSFRWILFDNFLFGVLDVVMAPLLLPLVCFPWRWVLLAREVKNHNQKLLKNSSPAAAVVVVPPCYAMDSLRWMLLRASMKGFLDLPICALVLIVTVVAPWRVFLLGSYLRREAEKKNAAATAAAAEVQETTNKAKHSHHHHHGRHNNDSSTSGSAGSRNDHHWTSGTMEVVPSPLAAPLDYNRNRSNSNNNNNNNSSCEMIDMKDVSPPPPAPLLPSPHSNTNSSNTNNYNNNNNVM